MGIKYKAAFVTLLVSLILTITGCTEASNTGGSEEPAEHPAPIQINRETDLFALSADEAQEQEGYGYHRTFDIVPVNNMLPARSMAVDRFYYTKIYLIALGDNGQNGPKVGCNDSLIAIERLIPPTHDPLRATLEELVAADEQYLDQLPLHNSLPSTDLQLSDVLLDADGKVSILLSGNHLPGDPCHTARLEAQLRETAAQVPAVKKVIIFIQDTAPVEETLSFF
jgi:hypothetical protein